MPLLLSESSDGNKMNTVSKRLDVFIRQPDWSEQPSSSLQKVKITEISLKDRLVALNKSVDNWQNHMKKEDLALFNSSLRVPEKTEERLNNENSLLYNNGTLLNLEKGLKSFFLSSVPYVPSNNFGRDDFNLDVIARTDILKIPKRPVIRKSRRPRNENRVISIDIKTDSYECPYNQFSTETDEEARKPLAKSAREGLQATENYSLVKNGLKQANTLSPYPPMMLIRIQGSKKVDVRLVSPMASSVHKSAVFILVTPNKLYRYEGKRSNVMEKATASQICRDIILKKDLQCSAAEVEVGSGYHYNFFSLLGGGDPCEGPDISSEPFENIVARINIVLRITDECKIQSVIKGKRVCFSILQPTETLIFDFGSEIYVWSGKYAKKESGRYAVEYARHLRLKPVFNSALLLGESLNEGRADWVLYRRIFQGVQDTLFASKFSDWQTSERKLSTAPHYRMKIVTSSQNIEETEARLLADYLLKLIHPQPVLVIEDHEFTRTMTNVITEDILTWVLNGEELEKAENTSIFNNDLCYVVRWQYRIQLSGSRHLKAGHESERETGRMRVAFFYWLGRRTTPKQQGICALKLSQIDKDKKPHIRVVQGTEPPLFLALFKGKFIIRSSLPDASPLFLVQGATALEGHAIQIEDDLDLRCHAVYLRVTEDITVIEGLTCNLRSAENALSLATEFKKNKKIFNIKDDSINFAENNYAPVNWITPIGRVKTPRFYRIYENEANELLASQYHEDLVFPIMQSYLCDTVLIDTGEKLWIWSERTPTTFALRTAEYFWELRKGPATVILKNSEPIEFKALFPEWRKWTTAEALVSPPRDLQDLMLERTGSFSIETLQRRSELPDGLNLGNLEQYLNKLDFERVFKMTKVEFGVLPLWKQVRLKKEARLF